MEATPAEPSVTVDHVDITLDDAAGDDAQHCLAAYYRELGERFATGYDPAQGMPADAPEMTEPAGLFLVGRLRGQPVACGGLIFHGDDPAEVKRMWVAPSVRGLGLASRLLTSLEDHARRRGVRVLRLDTNSSLPEAIALYRSAGYAEVARYNDDPYPDHWFEKHLN